MKILKFPLQRHIFGYSLKILELFWTDGVGWKVIRFYFDSKFKKETFSCDRSVFSSCVIQVNLLFEFLVAAFAITSLKQFRIFQKVDISWSHVELSILFISEWVTNLHILTHSNSLSYASRIHDFKNYLMKSPVGML